MSSFVDDIKDLINKQRSDVKKAFLGLHSPYVVREEYTSYVKGHQNVFEQSPGKRVVGSKVIVDPVRYKEVRQYRHSAPVPLQEPRVFSSYNSSEDPHGVVSGLSDAAVSRRLFDEENTEGHQERYRAISQSQKSQAAIVDKEAMDCAQSSFAEERINDQEETISTTAQLERLCKEELKEIFTAKDVKALSTKAIQLVSENAIREGFQANTYFVKSSSSPSPHSVKHCPMAKYVCDKDCIGFNTRKICSHVVAVAYKKNNLKEFLRCFKGDRSQANLTAVTTYRVNTNAGKKRPPRQRAAKRRKSPDTMSSMNKDSRTLGDLLSSQVDHATHHYQVDQNRDNNPLKVTLRKTAKPRKPPVTPTTSTEFELINITGRIRKCAGCFGNLKDGPGGATDPLDVELCVRHKENDFVWIDSLNTWKATFENKHFHVATNCITSRNPSFDSTSVRVKLNHTLSGNELNFLKDRLGK
jgi:hypothetical protein